MDKKFFNNAFDRTHELITSYDCLFISNNPYLTENLRNIMEEHIKSEMVKAARELLVAADEREEDKDPLAPYATYVSDIKFHTDGTATIKYNGGSLGRVVEVFAKGTKYEKDPD